MLHSTKCRSVPLRRRALRFWGNTGRLYYGTATFEVEKGVTRGATCLSLACTRRTHNDSPLWMHRPKGGDLPDAAERYPAACRFYRQWENTTPGGDGVYTIPIGGVITFYHETRASFLRISTGR